MPLEDISNPAGIQGAIVGAINRLEEAKAAVAREADGVAAPDLEAALVSLGEAQRFIGAAVINAAQNVNK